jgi:hypothetical protein
MWESSEHLLYYASLGTKKANWFRHAIEIRNKRHSQKGMEKQCKKTLIVTYTFRGNLTFSFIS